MTLIYHSHFCGQFANGSELRRTSAKMWNSRRFNNHYSEKRELLTLCVNYCVGKRNSLHSANRIQPSLLILCLHTRMSLFATKLNKTKALVLYPREPRSSTCTTTTTDKLWKIYIKATCRSKTGSLKLSFCSKYDFSLAGQLQLHQNHGKTTQHSSTTEPQHEQHTILLTDPRSAEST